ncbi:MAG: hypothetical protein NZM26_04050 [Patescibacteria group bacterium]|nr:hypothetical protein [Patescibacteria group bacterium]
MKSSKARQLHDKALNLREQQDLLQSLQVSIEALYEYAKDEDTLGFAELLSMMSKTYLHMFLLANYPPYLELAKSTAMACVSIAESAKEPKAAMLPYFNLGDIADEAGDLDLAILAYKKAIDIFGEDPPSRHNRKSLLANFKVHLASCEYRNGDKSALARAEEALNDLINSSDASEYEKDVWVSGYHMRIARMLKNDDPQKAKGAFI